MNTQENYTLKENNVVEITGKIVSGFTFSHAVLGEGFYTFTLSIQRLSDFSDIIPVMVSERLIDVTQDYEGEYIQIFGQFRSHSRYEEGRRKVELSVFAREISFVEDEYNKARSNRIFLDGYIRRKPIYRHTPAGREIADMVLAVKRQYRKSDYIPCICWGRNAWYVANLEPGTHLQVTGRIQSRVYLKKLEDGTKEERMAWEVSVVKIEEVDDED